MPSTPIPPPPPSTEDTEEVKLVDWDDAESEDIEDDPNPGIDEEHEKQATSATTMAPSPLPGSRDPPDLMRP